MSTGYEDDNDPKLAPLFEAASRGELLPGATWDIADNAGRTLAHEAAAHGHISVLPPEALKYEDVLGYTPIDHERMFWLRDKAPAPAPVEEEDDRIDFERLRREHPLENVVVALGIQRNADGYGCCPLPGHQETKPSWHINDKNPQKWHCFGCGESGDVVHLVMFVKGLPAKAAKALLDSGALDVPVPGVAVPPHPLPASSPVKAQVLKPAPVPAADPARLRAVLEEAWRYYSFVGNGKVVSDKEGNPVKPLHTQAREALELRGLGRVIEVEKALGQLLVGHTPAAADGLTKRLLAKGYTEEELLASGVSTRTKQNGTVIDTMRRRVVFPVRDEQGVIGFIGRRDLEPDRERKTEAEVEKWALDNGYKECPPKYINFPNTSLYRKAEALIWLTGPAQPGDSVVLVEGVMDSLAVAIAALNAGRLTGPRRIVPVCTSGKSMSTSQWARVAACKPKRVAIGLDSSGDVKNEERQAAVMAAEQAGIAEVVVVKWEPVGKDATDASEAKDPADVLKANGPEAVLANLRAAMPSKSAQVPSAQAPSTKPAAAQSNFRPFLPGELDDPPRVVGPEPDWKALGFN